MQTKSIFASKTAWVNFVIGISALSPSLQSWTMAHPVYVLGFLSVANIALRLISKDKVTFTGSDD